MKWRKKIALVCEQCHEIDKKVVGCNKPFDGHNNMTKGNCDICGKYGKVTYCLKYEKWQYKE